MIGWVDAGAGASGDMLLGALIGAGVPLAVVSEAVAGVAPEPIRIEVEPVTRNGLAATRCRVVTPESTSRRTWPTVAALLNDAPLDAGVRERALAAFARLAGAEAAVHGVPLDRVHFHEVGALDAIADVVGGCAGLEYLALDELVVSPVAVGSGESVSGHGVLSVPPPAVAELLRGAPSYSGPIAMEMCTPTGAALLTSSATSYAAQPPMTVARIGVGAGRRDPELMANVLRLFVGEPISEGGTDAILIEANVDDLDPRLWPHVLAALIGSGSSDAWLTPILMKKGRPAHTLSVLVARGRAPAVRSEIFRQTSTIGVREVAVGKHALAREMATVSVAGHPVRIKLAIHEGVVVNAQPEYDDVARVAAATARPAKDVLAEASSAGRALIDTLRP